MIAQTVTIAVATPVAATSNKLVRGLCFSTRSPRNMATPSRDANAHQLDTSSPPKAAPKLSTMIHKARSTADAW